MKNLNLSLLPDSTILVDSICRYIYDYETKYKTEGGLSMFESIEELKLNSTFEALPCFNETIRLINSNLSQLYKSGIRDNFYFFDCSVETYKSIYEIRKKSFIESHVNSNELDFLNEEEYMIRNPNMFRILKSEYGDIDYSKYLLRNPDFNIALKQKKEFIIVKIQNFGFNKEVFLSKSGQDWFEETIEKLGALDINNNPKRGFQAICAAIFTNTNCLKYIFRHNLHISVFIAYLRFRFQAKIRSDSKLSSGGNHEKKVEEKVLSYIKVMNQNKLE